MCRNVNNFNLVFYMHVRLSFSLQGKTQVTMSLSEKTQLRRTMFTVITLNQVQVIKSWEMNNYRIS
jgi:hypothetical protein